MDTPVNRYVKSIALMQQLLTSLSSQPFSIDATFSEAEYRRSGSTRFNAVFDSLRTMST
ncbi:hypothetical protein D3C85_1862630 [compost metagenome]